MPKLLYNYFFLVLPFKILIYREENMKFKIENVIKGALASFIGASMAFKFDIYLIDEVSAAGDQLFRKKCAKFLAKKLKESDFIMVNHNLWSLKPICDKAFILEKGKLLQFDDLNEAIEVHKEQLIKS